MSSEAPPGLSELPVTKLCMLATGLIPILASVADFKYLFVLFDDPFITEYKQYYRYFLFQIAAVNESDVALLTMVWYNLRHLERLFGSRKYLSIIVLCWLYTSATIIIANTIFNFIPMLRWNRFPNGALPTVLSLFHFYKEYTPQMYEFDVKLMKPFGTRSKQLKWTFNDHFVLNALISILLLNQGIVGLSVGFLSWLCGVFIDKGLLPGSEVFRIPFVFGMPSRSGRRPLVSNTGSTTATDIGNGQGNVSGNEVDEEAGDEPTRPLGVQFLDTFRM